MRQKKTFKIVCFYCHQVFEYVTDFAYMINRGYCYRADCEKAHQHNKQQRRTRWLEYREYVQKVRNCFVCNKKENIILLERRDDQIFKGEISLGKIVKEDGAFFYVQKNALASVSQYRKELIKL